MPLMIAQKDSAYKCIKCANILIVKKGQLVPPCPRCGGALDKVAGPAPPPESSECT